MTKQEKLMRLNGIESMKKPEPTVAATIVTDEIGNKYRQEIGTDGIIHLILTESYNGELYE